MSSDFQEQAWHRSIGKLIGQVTQPDFWEALIRLINEHVPIDNWVVLIFSNHQVQVVSYPESADADEKNAFLEKYVKGLYLLDPFYIANREDPQTGFFHLLDIAPAHFRQTEYHNLYFSEYIAADEAQYNLKLDTDKTLCLSMGSKVCFKPEHIAIFELIRYWVIALINHRISLQLDIEKAVAQSQSWKDILTHFKKPLTEREAEVFKLLLTGFGTTQIAGKLSIKPSTIKVHRRRIRAKLKEESHSKINSFFFQKSNLLEI